MSNILFRILLDRLINHHFHHFCHDYKGLLIFLWWAWSGPWWICGEHLSSSSSSSSSFFILYTESNTIFSKQIQWESILLSVFSFPELFLKYVVILPSKDFILVYEIIFNMEDLYQILFSCFWSYPKLFYIFLTLFHLWLKKTCIWFLLIN